MSSHPLFVCTKSILTSLRLSRVSFRGGRGSKGNFPRYLSADVHLQTEEGFETQNSATTRGLPPLPALPSLENNEILCVWKMESWVEPQTFVYFMSKNSYYLHDNQWVSTGGSCLSKNSFSNHVTCNTLQCSHISHSTESKQLYILGLQSYGVACFTDPREFTRTPGLEGVQANP